MKLAVSKKYIDLEDVESNLIDLRNLTELLWDYFKWDNDYVKANPYAITCGYRLNGSLVSAIMDAIDNTQEMLSMVQENQKAVTV